MNILIRGAGFQNKGAEAMLRVVQRELSARLPHINFYAAVRSIENTYASQIGISPVNDVIRVGGLRDWLYRLFRLYLRRDIARIRKMSLRAAIEIDSMDSIDAVIDVSGYAYGDPWSINKAIKALAWVEYCHQNRVPYIFMPQAWGPFKDSKLRALVRRGCQLATTVYVRDEESFAYLKALLAGVSCELKSAPDIAFRFRGDSNTFGKSVIKNSGLGLDGRLIIVFSPNLRVYEKTQGVGPSNKYVRLLIDLANHCIEKYDAHVVLIANEISVNGNAGPDDRFLCGMIESNIQSSDRCLALRDYLPSEKVKAVIGAADFLVSSRFHSLVFGLSQNVPVLAVGWSHKYRELLRSFSIQNLILEHDNIDNSQAISLFDSAWSLRHECKDREAEVVPNLQREIDGLFDSLAMKLSEVDIA